MKQIDFFDKDDQYIRTGIFSTKKAHEYNRGSIAFLFASDGELWIQKRALTDDSYPGRLDATCGGAVDVGESYKEALIREMKEEIGIQTEVTQLGKVAYNFKKKESDKDDFEWEMVYRGEYEGKFICNPAEVHEIQKHSLEDIRRMIENSQELFHPEALLALRTYIL